MLKGVSVVKPGYARSTGSASSPQASSGQAGEAEVPPTYELVSTGTTGYAEVVYIEYDSEKISYKDLLTVFFASHDPTTVNRQGDDIGTQYRSVIFFTTPEQEAEAGKFISEINNSSPEGGLVVTEVVPLEHPAKDGASFYEAENYHKDYYANNKGAPYCQLVINPKLNKVKSRFAKLLKQI